MRKSFLCLVIVILIHGTLMGQSGGLKLFILKGTIKGLPTGKVYLNYIGDKGGILDSANIEAGKFIFKGLIRQPLKAYISTFNPEDENMDESNFSELYIEPSNMKLMLTFKHFHDLVLYGSKSEQEWKDFLSSEAGINYKTKIIGNTIDRLDSQLRTQPLNHEIVAINLKEQIDSLNFLFKNLRREWFSIDSGFIADHPDSYISAYLLTGANSSWLSMASLIQLYNNFPDSIENSYSGMKIKFALAQEAHTSIGSEAKNFISVDYQGDTIHLDSYKGKKYVLLDFGASWCVPCRKIIPLLKDEYKKYDTAFTIISISKQDNYKDWVTAVKEDSVEWPQIFENKNHMPIYPPHKTINDSYYISGYPSLILIDKNFKIIWKYGDFYSSNSTSSLKKQIEGALKGE